MKIECPYPDPTTGKYHTVRLRNGGKFPKHDAQGKQGDAAGGHERKPPCPGSGAPRVRTRGSVKFHWGQPS